MDNETTTSITKSNQSTNHEDDENYIDGIGATGHNQICEQNIKSTAVVKYSAERWPARFCKLQSNTDLNLPPQNWLREDKSRILKGMWNSHSNEMAFSSLYMANDFPDCIGEVDVVSDAENIKKLLKIPYSKSPISMMVHRVGKTLLFDEFDIQTHLLQSLKKEWEWLRNFYLNHVVQTLRHKNEKSFRKNRKRDHLQNKNMMSKFLYYSIANSNSPEKRRESDDESPKNTCKPMTTPQTLKESGSVPVPEEERNVFDHDHSFQRNIVWNFEDISMLLGTDMPIFGGGTHPCVSLRLRDITKPINILCGLDYWLDNLICNVPEVLICYHQEGIVQKYERIKTEDIPKLDNSKFSPSVVKYIAQNILSFLKSKATNAGHTYWLIKAKDDDFVKLYDLTTLCAEALKEKGENPFTIPVAILLYRVARNMKYSGRKAQPGKIFTLLKNCLSFLDTRKYPEVVTSAHYLLSDIYVPSTIDLSAPLMINEDYNNQNSEVEEDYDISSQTDKNENGVISSCSVEVKALCLPDRSFEQDRMKTICTSPPKILEDRCQGALKHTEQGLSCIQQNNQELFKDENKVDNDTKDEEVQQQAKSFEPIPLPFKLIDSETKTQEMSLDKNKELNVKYKETPWHIPGSWQNIYTSLLLQKACASSYAMAYWLCNIDTHECGTALRYLELAFLTYDAVEQISTKMDGLGSQDLQFLPCYMLGLAGDLNFLFVQNHAEIETYKDQYNQFNSWEGIKNTALTILNKNSSYHWAVQLYPKIEDVLLNSHRCYVLALEKVGSKETKLKMQKRLGNIKNELGVYYMSQASNIYNEKCEVTDYIERLWKLSSEYLKAGVKIFEEIKDDANIIFLYSNISRLFRLQAFCHGSIAKDNREFTMKEKHLYNKAIGYYQMALRSIGKSEEFSNIRDSISWDLCTTYFTMATLLQDYPPISDGNLDKTEKDITELMLKALKLCDSEARNSRQPLYQYRAGIIQKRLGSLHHHSYRRAEEPRKKYQRTLAELHLSKAAELFKMLEDSSEYFKVQLERIGLWESHFASLTGTGAKEKCLRMLLDIILDTIPMMTLFVNNDEKGSTENHSAKADVTQTAISNESNPENTKEVNLDHLKLLQQQLHFVLLNFVKLYSKPNSTQKNDSVKFNLFKNMYSEALKQPSSGLSYSPSFFLDILSKVEILNREGTIIVNQIFATEK